MNDPPIIKRHSQKYTSLTLNAKKMSFFKKAGGLIVGVPCAFGGAAVGLAEAAVKKLNGEEVDINEVVDKRIKQFAETGEDIGEKIGEAIPSAIAIVGVSALAEEAKKKKNKS